MLLLHPYLHAPHVLIHSTQSADDTVILPIASYYVLFAKEGQNVAVNGEK